MSSPPDAAIESTIRDVIANLYATDNLDQLTVKRVRIAVEQELTLLPGWFKSHGEWKDRSKTFIEEEAARQAENEDDVDELQSSEEEIVKPTKRQSKKRSSVEVESAPRKKVKSAPQKPDPSRIPSRVGPRKSKKKVVDSDEEDSDTGEDEAQSDTEEADASMNVDEVKKTRDLNSDSDMSEPTENDPPPTKRNRSKNENVTKKKAKAAKENQAKSTTRKDDAKKSHKPPAEVSDDQQEGKQGGNAAQSVNGDESDSSAMSVLIDDGPVKGKGRSSAQATMTTKEKKPKAKAKASKDSDLDPQAIEIKKLKEWLAKCGIRKMWFKELAPYDTPQKQIAHLKEMLKDAGMNGRPSIAKANEIRERRELAEELDEAQKFAQQWGKKEKRDKTRSAAEAMASIGFELDDESE